MGIHSIYLAIKNDDSENYSIVAGKKVNFFKNDFTLKDLPVFYNNIITFPYGYKLLNDVNIQNSQNVESIIILNCENGYESKVLGDLKENEKFSAFLFEHTQIKVNENTNKTTVTFNGSDKNILLNVKVVNGKEVKIIDKEVSQYEYHAVDIHIDPMPTSDDWE